ncbi:MAG: hypothetical protein WAU72_07295 [Acidimicrobiia bacterium]
MTATFMLDNKTIGIQKSIMTGSVKIFIDGEEIDIQNAWNPASQFQFASKKTYELVLLGHNVTIQREKPLLFGYYRKWIFHIWVDGQFLQSVAD